MLQVITAARDLTGGPLGYTPERYNGGNSIYAVQFLGKETWYLIALGIWSVALLIRYRVERSMLRYALEVIAEDEDAAAAAGVHVTVEKLKSAVMTAFAGALYCQYQTFVSPNRVSGIGVSLRMVFAAVVGGLYVPLGADGGCGDHDPVDRDIAHLVRHCGGRLGQFGLRHLAGIVHHLSAAGPARFGAGLANPEGGRST